MEFIKVTAMMCDKNGKTIIPVHERDFLLNVDLILIIEKDGTVITKESNDHNSAIQLKIGEQYYNSITTIQEIDEAALSL